MHKKQGLRRCRKPCFLCMNATASFPIRHNRTHTITNCPVSQGKDRGVDERENNDAQGNPGLVVERRRLIRLHQRPQGKANR
ncbi:MAG TPA: hypothetical protein VKU38_06240 [Ktedonobacteraceae bacterium]|nr:hypothetical protein [Ktedonobacteraceae bacterium]